MPQEPQARLVPVRPVLVVLVVLVRARLVPLPVLPLRVQVEPVLRVSLAQALRHRMPPVTARTLPRRPIL
ncbi:MAG: hypothetical protein OXI16_10730 [Chloroflexota bacterium]|nr:hypothetical protein [Chloroflexota bacterium]